MEFSPQFGRLDSTVGGNKREKDGLLGYLCLSFYYLWHIFFMPDDIAMVVILTDVY